MTKYSRRNKCSIQNIGIVIEKQCKKKRIMRKF